MTTGGVITKVWGVVITCSAGVIRKPLPLYSKSSKAIPIHSPHEGLRSRPTSTYLQSCKTSDMHKRTCNMSRGSSSPGSNQTSSWNQSTNAIQTEAFDNTISGCDGPERRQNRPKLLSTRNIPARRDQPSVGKGGDLRSIPKHWITDNSLKVAP